MLEPAPNPFVSGAKEITVAEADPNLRDAHTRMPSLEGRKAAITGGTTGIGRAIGVLLASEGVAEKMLRAEDIAVAAHFLLTQPRRAVVNQLAVTQRIPDE
jgi:NADP-dependent 3-hydroxy acid dehydrogenase YdfG